MTSAQTEFFKRRFGATSILQAEGQGFESPKLHLRFHPGSTGRNQALTTIADHSAG
jgi:hypothetical protein